MQLPFYQSHWFDIDLEKLAKSLGHDKNSVAESSLYHQVYKELSDKNYISISDAWIKNKYKLSEWLEGYFVKKNLDKGRILSIGCGLGIVEKPLLDRGFCVDLQECQEISIQYLREKHPKTYAKTHFILSQDLKEVRDSSYDSVIAITSTYCLNDLEIEAFLLSVSRVLKPEGTFIWYETLLTWPNLLSYVKQTFLKKQPQGILWGWKRTKSNFVQKAKKCKLRVKKTFYFDKCNNPTSIQTLFGIPCNFDASWQMIVFKKHD